MNRLSLTVAINGIGRRPKNELIFLQKSLEIFKIKREKTLQ